MATMSERVRRLISGLRARAADLATSGRALGRTIIFLFTVFPMLPDRPFRWLTPPPVVERLRYATTHGAVEGALYRPGRPGPYPGLVVCLGVVPFGVEHPQVPRLGAALARAGFAALLYWSPAMRAMRLEPADIDDVAAAYAALLAWPAIDPARSGLLGTCVGGAFALMAASRPPIRDRVAFVMTYAAYATLETLMRDIASASRYRHGRREPWAVDPLTRQVYLHSLTALLDEVEAQRLRQAGHERRPPTELGILSTAGQAIVPLLGTLEPAAATAALRHLPAALRARLGAMSPTNYLPDLRAPLLLLLHDREDGVIPVAEAYQLRAALTARPGLRFTEFTVFRHLDPTKGKPAPLPLARELLRFAQAVYPVFRLAADRSAIPGGSDR